MTGEHTSVIYGTHYPNRLFVGCLPPEAGAEDLGAFFSDYGNVVEAKVVLDDKGRSKRFGFVTFSNKEHVAELIKSRAIKFQGKMINVGPAVKKNMESEPAAGGNQNQQRPQKTPPPSSAAPTSSGNKSSIYKGPQHVPKTIIRKSPAEEQMMEAEQQQQIGKQHQPQQYAQQPQQQQYRGRQKVSDNSTFSNMWGISSRKNSVWTQSELHQSHDTSAGSSQGHLDTSYSSLISSLDSSLSSPRGDQWYSSSNNSFPFDNTSWGRCALGSINPPPGFYQSWYEK